MTHLRIEQSTGSIEEVSASIISKLYELAYAGLDASSNLLGRLHVAATYLSYVTYLTTNYPDLYILSDDYYVEFADPEVARIFASSNYGDGNGLLLSSAATITNLNNVTVGGVGDLFKNNTTIEHFDELGLFTNVTQLGLSPFIGTTNLKSIDLSNITFINQECFKNSGLTGVVNLPNLIQTQSYPFHSCNNITQLNFSSVLTNIGNGLCGYMNGLLTVTGLSHLTTIYNSMFVSCTNLSSIDIDWSKITTVEDCAFLYCSSLASIIDLSNVTSMGQYAFKECSSLSGVLNLTECLYIGDYAFLGCSKITEIHAPKCTSIGMYGHWNNLSNIEVIDLPVSDRINSCIELQKLTTVNAPLAVYFNTYNTGQLCMEGCPMLSTLNINFSAVTSLANWCFYGDSGLNGQYLEFPNVTLIDTQALMNNGINFIFSNNSVVTLTGYGWFDNYTGTIYVPDNLVNTYKTTSGWSNISNLIKGVSELPAS